MCSIIESICCKNRICNLLCGLYHKRYHNLKDTDRCSVCGSKEHNKTLDDHDICTICKGFTKFTHPTYKHIDHLELNKDLKLKSGQFEICFRCNKVVFLNFTETKCRKCKYPLIIRKNEK